MTTYCSLSIKDKIFMNVSSRLPIFVSLAVCVFVLSACATTPTSSTTETSIQSNEMPSRTASADVMQSPTTQQAATETGTKMYKDTVQYTSPAGPEEIGVNLSVENGVVKSVDVEVKATNSTSVNRQLSFKNSLQSAIVGKPLTGLQVDRVGGSSLTSRAFDQWVKTLE